MRIVFSIIFIALIAALIACYRNVHRSEKAIASSVGLLIGALLPPLIGNLIIIASSEETLSTIGYYIYFLGMDAVMFALLRFTLDYCAISGTKHRRFCVIAYMLLGIDVIQYAVNLFTKHAFGTEPIEVSGAIYYRLKPYLGQSFHRIVDYGILAAVIIIFIIKTIKSPKINSERYSVILAVMIITTVWETAYIFSRAPIDRAMIGFGVFGLLVYYLALFYRPLRLLDSMLANMASEIPEALFFFDAGGQCIWANPSGIRLVNAQEDNYEPVANNLREMFGDYMQTVSSQHEVSVGEQTRSYVLEMHNVTDERQRPVGSFLSVRDNTLEQETLQQEIYKATHDSLTALYNRAGYDLLLSNLDLKTTCLLLIDADNFKAVNDTHGHETGDKVLQKIAEAIRHNFRAEDCACRIGGDEFVVFMVHTGDKQNDLIVSRIDRINDELANAGDGLPPVSVSAGIAHGDEGVEPVQLFERADRALYETKNRGKCGYTFYIENSKAN